MPFVKGDPNINRSGRPKRGWTMSELIQEALEEEGQKQGYGRGKVNKLIARKLAQMAVRGDILAIKEINDRIDGKARQTNVHEGNKDNPIKFEVVRGS